MLELLHDAIIDVFDALPVPLGLPDDGLQQNVAVGVTKYRVSSTVIRLTQLTVLP